MSKYSVQFKLAVFQQYLLGTAGYKQIAQEHGLSHSMVEKWVCLHRAHGTDGLAKKFNHYSAAFKLSVLQRMLDDELSFTQVAAAFNIRSVSCISQWERC